MLVVLAGRAARPIIPCDRLLFPASRPALPRQHHPIRPQAAPWLPPNPVASRIPPRLPVTASPVEPPTP
jgi:hypothetical protein